MRFVFGPLEMFVITLAPVIAFAVGLWSDPDQLEALLERAVDVAEVALRRWATYAATRFARLWQAFEDWLDFQVFDIYRANGR